MSLFEKKYEHLKEQIRKNKINEIDYKENLLWYKRKITSLNFYTNPKDIINNQKSIKKTIEYGNLYHFLYSPKTKEKLPYYDRFPLVFPVQKTDGGFLGLNLHYIDYNTRMILMKNLYDYEINKSVPDKIRLVLTYRLLNKTKSLKHFKPCLKRYLYSHIKSNFLHIHHSEWNIVLFLPTEQFQNENKKRVWEESLGKIEK
jgi:hypothetical protein